MKAKTTYPPVVSVKPMAGKRLLVRFANGAAKVYDCRRLISEQAFRPLADEALFRTVQAAPGGYGVFWNDEIDLAESELWINGKTAEQAVESDTEARAR